jgi:hypothetical protein
MASNEEVVLGEIDKFMNKVADRIHQLANDNLLRPHIKVFKSGKSEEVITSDTFNLGKTSNVNRRFLEKDVIFPAPYAEDVEFGNAGKVVKPEDLHKWVRRKLGIRKESEIKRISINIAKSLAERGQSPDPYLQPAIAQAKMEFGI